MVLTSWFGGKEKEPTKRKKKKKKKRATKRSEKEIKPPIFVKEKAPPYSNPQLGEGKFLECLSSNLPDPKNIGHKVNVNKRSVRPINRNVDKGKVAPAKMCATKDSKKQQVAKAKKKAGKSSKAPKMLLTKSLHQKNPARERNSRTKKPSKKSKPPNAPKLFLALKSGKKSLTAKKKNPGKRRTTKATAHSSRAPKKLMTRKPRDGPKNTAKKKKKPNKPAAKNSKAPKLLLAEKKPGKRKKQDTPEKRKKKKSGKNSARTSKAPKLLLTSKRKGQSKKDDAKKSPKKNSSRKARSHNKS